MLERRVYTLAVDYDKPLQELINDGNHTWVNKDITEKRYPQERVGSQNYDIRVFSLGRLATETEVLEQMSEEGRRPLGPYESIAFAGTYPEAQLGIPIGELASQWEYECVYKNMVTLFGDENGRGLGLWWRGSPLLGQYRFLTIPEDQD